MNVSEFLDSITATYNTGIAGEHSYRPAIQQLIESLDDDLMVINEASRIKCGAPDLVISIDDVPVGYIEAKDIDVGMAVFKGGNLRVFNQGLKVPLALVS